VPATRQPGGEQDRAAQTLHRSHAACLWAMLLARIYEVSGPPRCEESFEQSPAFDPSAAGPALASLGIRPDRGLVNPGSAGHTEAFAQLGGKPPVTLLAPARPASGSLIRPADRPPRQTSPEP
jgi:hypothetical protein